MVAALAAVRPSTAFFAFRLLRVQDLFPVPSSSHPISCCGRCRGIDLAKIAEKLPGASGAEIKAVCTESGMYALRERRVHVTQEDFEMAVAKVCNLHPPRISKVLRPSK